MNFTQNQIILLFLAIILLYLLYTSFSKQKENLTETEENKDKLAGDILKYLKQDTEYKDYIDFIAKIPYNLSYKLLEQEVFYEMKFLLKNKKLNKNTIKNLITDM